MLLIQQEGLLSEQGGMSFSCSDYSSLLVSWGEVEISIGKPLSPYAMTKYVNDLCADLPWTLVHDRIQSQRPDVKIADPVYHDFCLGDVRHSLADVRKAEGLIGYQPSSFHIGPGL
jgi:hypothetical protein